ncbi:MAG: hypothetical protein E4G94_10540 [ANME-2 cluster archaeon]|nr:MAG: hypothetical protein E4G94_10540 [ANME-2 cluster archaeon]
MLGKSLALLVAISIILALAVAPANAVTQSNTVTLTTCACIGNLGVPCTCGENANFPPTIDNVDPGISLLGDDLTMQVSIEASDADGVDDIDYVVATLYYENFARLYSDPPSPPRMQLDLQNLPLDSILDSDTGIYTGTLTHTQYKPGFYILKVQVFDKKGAYDTEEIPVLTIAGIKGDFSGDGNVNGWDMVYLARHLASINNYENIYCYEVSGDVPIPALNGWDIVYLARAIAGIYVL